MNSKCVLIKIAVFILMLFVALGNSRAASIDFIYSNKKYQSNIELSSYIISEDQVCNAFSNINDLEQLSHNDLFSTSNYILILFKNKGNLSAWGNLSVSVNNMKYIEIPIPFLSGNKKEFGKQFLIPFERPLPKDNKKPVINIKWSSLYTK